MHGGLSPALRGRQAGAPIVRGPARPRREPTAIRKKKLNPPLKQKLRKNKITPLLFTHTYAEKKRQKKKSRTTHSTLEDEPTSRDSQGSAHKSSWSSSEKRAQQAQAVVAHSSFSQGWESDVSKTASVGATDNRRASVVMAEERG